MLNLYKDLGNYNRFVPYIGAGIGLALLPQEPGFFVLRQL
jgi:opacity protein-like surface antigen